MLTLRVRHKSKIYLTDILHKSAIYSILLNDFFYDERPRYPIRIHY